MKQSEVIIGNSYLFKGTDTLHKKDMIGQVVTVIGKKSAKTVYKNYLNPKAKTPIRFKLSNGRCANAGELGIINIKQNL
jgi:hypothetical protein